MKLILETKGNPHNKNCEYKNCQNSYAWKAEITVTGIHYKVKVCDQHAFGITDWEQTFEESMNVYFQEFSQKIKTFNKN